MKLRPHNDWLLVRNDPERAVTAGGIIKPEGAHEEVHEWGTVIEVGPGKFYDKLGARVPLEVKPGDRVYYIKFLKKTHTGQAISNVLDAIEPGTFLIQEKDIIVAEQGERAA
jgi:chaperonin GroES